MADFAGAIERLVAGLELRRAGGGLRCFGWPLVKVQTAT